MPRITDFCICMYVFGCKLSLCRLCYSDFGITPVHYITIGITCTVFCFHIALISLASSRYLSCFSVIILVRLFVFGTAMSIKRRSFLSYSWELCQVIIIIIIIIYSLKISAVLAMCKLRSHKKDRSAKSAASRWLLIAQDHFAPRIVHMGLEVDRMAQGQTSLRVLLYVLSVIIPPQLLVYTFITPRCTVDPLDAAVLQRHNLTPSRQ